MIAYALGQLGAWSRYGVKEAAGEIRFGKPSEAENEGPGNRGTFRDIPLRLKKKDIGEIGYLRHPEGHAEIKSFFIDDEHQGKGYGQQALRRILDEHGHVLSDTRTGTTGDAQRAFKRLLAKLPDVVVKDLKAKELGGGKYEDMLGDPTSIWYARKNDVPGLSDEDLAGIVHNAMYHRRRQNRTALGAGAGAAAGALASFLLPQHAQRALGTTLPMVVGSVGGGVLGGVATNKLQHLWDAAHNLEGDW